LCRILGHWQQNSSINELGIFSAEQGIWQRQREHLHQDAWRSDFNWPEASVFHFSLWPNFEDWTFDGVGKRP
jgi:hypothetical protein